MYYSLRKQINDKGYQVGLELESINLKDVGSSFQIDFDLEEHSEKWKESVAEGVALFYNQYQTSINGKTTLKITNIHWFQVDTFELLIRYFAIRVLSEKHQLDFFPVIDNLEFESLRQLNDLRFVFDDVSSIYKLE